MKRMTTLVPAIPCQARERVSLAFILLIILFLSGCKTSKKVGTVASGSAKAHNEFFESMEEHSFQFNTMTARLNAELKTAKNNMSSRVDLKMVRDSAFQLSLIHISYPHGIFRGIYPQALRQDHARPQHQRRHAEKGYSRNNRPRS